MPGVLGANLLVGLKTPVLEAHGFLKGNMTFSS
jgi:hypothetical protein